MSALRRLLTRPVLARIAADGVAVQAALAAAYGLRFVLVALAADRAIDLHELAVHYVQSYGKAAVPLGLIALFVFAFDGFYHNGRFYRGRYRYVWIAQAVALVYACFATVAFLNNNFFEMPRGVVPLGAILTAASVVGLRMASAWWADVLRREGRLRRGLGTRRIDTVLVIGGAGYIGSALLPRLLEHGYRVRLLDLLLFGTEPLGESATHPNLEIVKADFRQIDKIVEAMRGVDAVIHLGGIVGDPACAVDEELTIDINLTATRVVAEVARGEGVERFIFASTCSVYGSGTHDLNEDSALNPLSLYARTKLASERVLHRMAGDDFTPVILRFGTIYGLSGRTRFDLVVNLLTAKATREGKITVFGGDQWRPFVHVDDAGRAVLAAIRAPLDSVRDETFNVGSDAQNFTIDQIGKMVADGVPGAQVVQMGSDTDKRDYHVSFKKIRRVLGFEPEWTVERGIQQVHAALQEREINYGDAQYSNLKSLTEEHTSMLFKPERDWPAQLLADTEGKPKRDEASTSGPTVH